MSDATRLFQWITRSALAMICMCTGAVYAQAGGSTCIQPLCVNRTDDDAATPAPGMLRYAARHAPAGGAITFDPALNGRVIELDKRSPGNHIKVERNLSIEGPGADLLTIDGGNATRIFYVADGTVRISGVSLVNGRAKGGGGAVASGGGRGGVSGSGGCLGGAGAVRDADGGNAIAAGGGYGGSALGGAIFVRSGQLQLRDVTFTNNSSTGGLGAAGAPNGIAKGGAIFICSSFFCGPGHDGVGAASGKIVVRSSSAAEAGADTACSPRDDADVCGLFLVAPAVNDTKH